MQIPDLLVDKGLSTGGASVRQLAIAVGLTRVGQEVGILTWKGAKDFVNRELEFELVESYPPKGGIRFLRVIYYNFLKCYQAVKKYSPDYLFTKGSNLNSGVLALVAKLLGVPLVYIVTNDKDVDDRYKVGLKGIARRSYEYSLKVMKVVICQNAYQMKSIKSNYPGKKYFIVHNPYYHSKPLPEMQLRTQRSYVAWLGVFSHQKNLPDLVKIVQQCPNIPFKVAGSVPSGTMSKSRGLDDASRIALKKLKQCPNVELMGFLKRNEVPIFLSKAVVLLNTSHYEGFSNTFLESFAVGTPVITRQDIDPDSIISNNGLGTTVAHYDHAPSAIRDLFQIEDYKSISEKCRDYLKVNHSVISIAKQIVQGLEAPN